MSQSTTPMQLDSKVLKQMKKFNDFIAGSSVLSTTQDELLSRVASYVLEHTKYNKPLHVSDVISMALQVHHHNSKSPLNQLEGEEDVKLEK